MDELLADVEIPAELSEYDRLVAYLLTRRGVETSQAAAAFLEPDYESGIHDPWRFKDMEQAAQRILDAIANDGRVVIFSDYDMDGIPGAVVLHDFFQAIGFENFTNEIPHRNRDGFGLKEKHVDQFVDDEVDLVITVDCGISSIVPIEKAAAADIDVVVTDHHLPPETGGEETLPQAVAIIDPQQSGCEYPNKNICGAGVAWQLVRALIDRGKDDDRLSGRFSELPAGFVKWQLDMVGMATVADMVSLVGENRVLAHYGLVVLRQSRRPGIRALCSKSGASQKNLTEDDIGFSLGPRINAASRMDAAIDAFRLLVAEDDEEAHRLANRLEEINKQRKGAVGAMTKAARKKVEKQLSSDPDVPVIVVGSPKWKPSLCGLVATRLTDAYDRPAFVWGRGDGSGSELRGSCRSDDRVDVHALMQATPPDFFTHCGGHAFSGGFGVMQNNVHELRDTLVAAHEALEQTSDTRDLEADGESELELPLGLVSWQTWDRLKQLAPFGEGNPQPVFTFPGVAVKAVKHFGKQKNHLKLILKNGTGTIEAIAFFKTAESYETDLSGGERITLAANIEKDTFGYGPPSLRLQIIDIT